MNIWCKSDAFDAWGFKHLKITMRSSGFHHLHVKMRLRHANSGLIWIQNYWFIMNIWCKQHDPFSAWGFKILIYIFHYPGSRLPSPPLFIGGCLITIPRPPPIVIDVPNWNKKRPLCIYIYIYIYRLLRPAFVLLLSREFCQPGFRYLSATSCAEHCGDLRRLSFSTVK